MVDGAPAPSAWPAPASWVCTVAVGCDDAWFEVCCGGVGSMVASLAFEDAAGSTSGLPESPRCNDEAVWDDAVGTVFCPEDDTEFDVDSAGA